jgi:hypothetical protein
MRPIPLGRSAIAKGLECDEDNGRFETKLGNLAKAPRKAFKK